jgi:hypothetical protein
MIRHLQHHEIDKTQWDECIAQSDNSLIYGYSWYLDSMAPGWEALVYGDRYEAVFPLTHRKKIFRYLYQPLLTQQLGLFYRGADGAQLLDQFIEAIPFTFRFINIQLNENNHPAGAYQLTKRKNFVLNLNKPYEKLYKAYSEHAKRNLKKSHKLNLSIKPVESNAALDFYIKHKGNITAAISQADYSSMRLLFAEAAKRNNLQSFGVFNELQELLATAIVFVTPQRFYLINNCASAKGRNCRAMYLMIDDLVRKHAGQSLLLDFEGSDIEGIAHFNKGFGAYKQPYSLLCINRLPWYVRWLKG